MGFNGSSGRQGFNFPALSLATMRIIIRLQKACISYH